MRKKTACNAMNTLDLLAFQNEVTMALIMCNKNISKKRGHPSLHETIEPPRKVRNAELRPANAVRYDGLNHWPAHSAQPLAERCKFESCTSGTRGHCQKCNVYLCLSVNKNCFDTFHNKCGIKCTFRMKNTISAYSL